MFDAMRHRELFTMLVWRSLSTRYRQMALGVAWGLLEPLLQVVIISLFFGLLFRLPSDGIQYPLFALAGLLPWILFLRVTNSAASSMRENMNLISKVDFPRILLPASVIVKDLIDVLALFVFVLIVVVASGIDVSANLVFLPAFVLMDVILAFGVGALFATPMVRFRDLNYILQVGLQFWMYATPIVYSSQLVPGSIRWIYEMNPLYWVVEGFRWCILGKPIHFTASFYIAIGLVAAVLAGGLLVFAMFERKVVDYQ